MVEVYGAEGFGEELEGGVVVEFGGGGGGGGGVQLGSLGVLRAAGGAGEVGACGGGVDDVRVVGGGVADGAVEDEVGEGIHLEVVEVDGFERRRSCVFKLGGSDAGCFSNAK